MSVMSTTAQQGQHLIAPPPKTSTDGANHQLTSGEPQFYTDYVNSPFEHTDDMYNSWSQQQVLGGPDESASYQYSQFAQQQNDSTPMFSFQPSEDKQPKEFDTEPDPLAVNNDHDTFVDWNGGGV